jgi:hypothetical protein
MSTSQITAPFREAMPGDISSYDVEGDLTALEYTFVELDTVRNRCVKAWSSGLPVGLLCNRPIEDATSTAFSTVAQVQLRGKGLCKAGSGGLAAGDWVKVTTGGVGVKATPTAGDVIVGQCEVAAAEGLPATIRLIGPFYYAVS